MATPSRKSGGKAPNDRKRPEAREPAAGDWNRQTDDTASQRASERAIPQADGDP